MVDAKICDWLMDNADAPIRYRVARELLKDAQAVKGIEKELLENPVVTVWLKNLKPESPPQHPWMEHGSFDYCFENAMLKAVQLGLHAGLPEVTNAVAYYIGRMASSLAEKPLRNCEFHDGFDNILRANLLTLAGVDNETIRSFLLGSLEELYHFVQKGDCDIYCTEDEGAALKGVPKIWRERKFIKSTLLNAYGFCYPLIYDVVGLHTLYGLKDPEVRRKVDAIIDFISTDIFHSTVVDGYGIFTTDNNKYYSMGWDPKYPGWYDVDGCLKSRNAPKILFYAQYISKYPSSRETKWYHDLLACLEGYRSDNGTYIFPSEWLKESQGYAVLGSHVSFGENRRKKNWREIESTFYMQLLQSSLQKTHVLEVNP